MSQTTRTLEAPPKAWPNLSIPNTIVCINDYLSKKTGNLKVVNSETLCEKFGSAKFFNVAVLGVAFGAGYLDISKDAMIQAIECTVKKDFIETNKEVFNHGIASV